MVIWYIFWLFKLSNCKLEITRVGGNKDLLIAGVKDLHSFLYDIFRKGIKDLQNSSTWFFGSH